jgi:hypothetical protein
MKTENRWGARVSFFFPSEEVGEKRIDRKEKRPTFSLSHSFVLFTLRSPSPLRRLSSIEVCIEVRKKDESIGTWQEKGKEWKTID